MENLTHDNPQLVAQVTALNKKILDASAAYYAGNDPGMTDAEFDVLEAQLRGLLKTSPWLANLATSLKKVGSAPQTSGRVKHVRPMLSIENKYEKNEISEFFQLVESSILLEPKRDGISCELRYRNGELVQALTRGDGESGEDMTAQVKALKNVPKTLPDTFPTSLSIRGELVMRTSEMERINKEAEAKGTKLYVSTRNLTAGTMKQQDLAVVASRDVFLSPWDVYCEDATLDAKLPDSAYERMRLLEGAGFPGYEGWLVSEATDVQNFLEGVLEKNSKSDVCADGVVAKVDSHKKRKGLGVSSKYTNYQVCFKPQSAASTTYLRSVTWQIGRQGKLSPVAECDAVVLAGARVTRASLNNITWINNLGLTVNAKVKMLRSGDVIPQVTEVIEATDEPILVPTICPDCKGAITEHTDDGSKVTTHWCENDECPGRVADLFSHIGSRDILEIDSLAADMAERLVANNFAINLAELFEFQVEALQQIATVGEEVFVKGMAKKGFSGANTLKMVKSMENAKTADWDRWIAALDIPMIGKTFGKVLSKLFKLKPEDMHRLPEIFKAVATTEIDGIGFHKREEIVRWATSARAIDTCNRLAAAGVRPKGLAVAEVSGEQPLKGVSFCITGEFAEERNSLSDKLVSLGAEAKSGVTKKVNLLIVGSAPGKSKLAKAKELGIKEVGAYWLGETLKAHGFAVELTEGYDHEEA